MDWRLLFLNSILLGFGLALDAFSVSVADAMANPDMKKGKKVSIALTFAVFQTLMPLLGWICVRTIADRFTLFQKAIPYIALILLAYIGIKMIIEAKKGGEEEDEGVAALTFTTLMVQGVATSIDALSVGFAIADYSSLEAIISTLLVGVTTFIICILGLELGKKVGKAFSDKATVFGGSILIIIGLEIFIKGVFF